MEKLKLSLIVVIVSLILIPYAFAKTDGNDEANLNSLKVQLQQEIKDVLHSPVYLSYSDKDLKGTSFVTLKVNNSGKFEIIKVTGKNDELNSLISKKINSKNLWTPKKYANKYFSFKVEMI